MLTLMCRRLQLCTVVLVMMYVFRVRFGWDEVGVKINDATEVLDKVVQGRTKSQNGGTFDRGGEEAILARGFPGDWKDAIINTIWV
jgi:hypothetical protein